MGMTTHKLPQTLPPPTEDAERLKQAFDGSSPSLPKYFILLYFSRFLCFLFPFFLNPGFVFDLYDMPDESKWAM